MIGARPASLAVAAALAAAVAVAFAASSAASSAGPAEIRICAGLDEAAPPGAGPALLVFFSTDCSVCTDDLFEARYLVDKGRWPVAVIGVAAGPREELARFLEKHAWTLPVVLDRRKALARRFRVDAVPFKALLLGSETIYRDDPYIGLEDRRKELKRCLTRHFSR
jgi:hypothetical protein